MMADELSVKEDRYVAGQIDVDGDNKPDMRTTAAAEYIGSTESTLRTWRCQRRGPAYYRGLSKEILYRKADLDAFIRSRRIEPMARQQSAELSR